MSRIGRRLAVRGGGRQAGAVRTPRSPVLVGRRTELATALGLVDAAVRGHGGALLVVGEAGVGKSRLVDELRARAAAAGMTVLVGRSVADGGTYRAVTEALARLLRLHPRIDDPALQPYRAALGRLLPGLPDAEPLPRAPDPTVMLGEGVLALLAGRSTLLVLEDLHWADPDTLDLVRYLAGALTDAPVLLVATARDDAAEPGTARLAAEVPTVALRRLDADGVAALAAACRGAPLPDAERDELVAGRKGCRCWSRSCSPLARRVPPSFTGLVAGRLAALTPSARRVVLAAAVLGDPDWRLLAAITASPSTTRPAASEAGPPDQAPPDADDAETAAARSATVPDAAVPDAAVPDAAVPDAAVPHATVPHATVPHATVPHATVPDAAVPDPAVPHATGAHANPRPTRPCPTRPCPTRPCPTRPCPTRPCPTRPCP